MNKCVSRVYIVARTSRSSRLYFRGGRQLYLQKMPSSPPLELPFPNSQLLFDSFLCASPPLSLPSLVLWKDVFQRNIFQVGHRDSAQTIFKVHVTARRSKCRGKITSAKQSRATINQDGAKIIKKETKYFTSTKHCARISHFDLVKKCLASLFLGSFLFYLTIHSLMLLHTQFSRDKLARG